MAIIIPFNNINDKISDIYPSNVVRKNGSNNLYISIRYKNKQIVKTTGLEDTPHNRAIAQTIADAQKEKIMKGEFRFAKEYPNSSLKMKEYFLESGVGVNKYFPSPSEILFNEYSELIEEKYIITFEKNIKKAYISPLNLYFRPFLKYMTFYDITGEVLCSMIETDMRHKKGPNKGKKLSKRTVKNNFTVLTMIWKKAIEQFRWYSQIGNAPQYALESYKFPKGKNERKENVYRFHEFKALIDAVDSYYKPHLEMAILTGLMPSELAGIKKESILDDTIKIERSITGDGEEKDDLKNQYRFRDVPITKKINEVIQLALNKGNSENPYVFQMEDGTNLDTNKFRTIIKKTFEEIKLEYKTPYMFRHSFVAWSLVIGIDLLRISFLMGHASKQMVFDTYGKYVQGLEKDANFIREYMGDDFV